LVKAYSCFLANIVSQSRSGFWFGVYKVNNKEVWDKYIKTGAVKGFSVEGIFADKTILAKKQEYAFTKS